MNLQEELEKLSKEKQFELAIKLAKLAMPLFCGGSYRDSVVGLSHNIDSKLLSRTVDAVEEYLKMSEAEKINGKIHLLEIRKQFYEPISALTDSDWEISDPEEKIFYSVFNLASSITEIEREIFIDSMLNAAINQAIDALDTSGTLPFDELYRLYIEK